jgi:peptidoglycan-associated lipoprotein
MKIEHFVNFLVIVALLIASACASKPPVEPVEEKPVEVVKPEPTPAPVVEVKQEVEQVAIVEEAPAVIEVAPPESVEINFAYDSAELNDEAIKVIETHAEYLTSHPDRFIIIAGHADERGTEDYNQRLGLMRASAIRGALLLNGVKAEQLKTISYGEKQPKLEGKGESVWQENRRAVFLYNPTDEQISEAEATTPIETQMFVSDN